MAPPTPELRRRPANLLAALLGSFLSYLLARHLPLVPSTLLSSLWLAAGASLSGRVLSSVHWWLLLGGTTGSLVGSSAVLANKLQQTDPQAGLEQRLTMLLCLTVAGTIAGRRLSLDAPRTDRRRPRDLLRSASALTTGIFAVLVTLTFLHSGLDAARAFSSRLSTALTILITTLTAPGWLVHLLLSPGSPDGSI